MAIWSLDEPHYLLVPDHYWEQTETDRDTGKQKRKKYPVPTHLNPKDPADWTHKSGDRHISQGGGAFTDGEIIVRWALGYTHKCPDGSIIVVKNELMGDDKRVDHRILIFEGPPTPGMKPIDDEAKEINARLGIEIRSTTKDLYNSEMTFADKMLEKLADRTNAVTPDTQAMLDKMGETTALLTQLMAQNQRLIEQLTSKEPRRI